MGVKTSRYRGGKTLYKWGKNPGIENFEFPELKTSSSGKGVKTSIEGEKIKGKKAKSAAAGSL